MTGAAIAIDDASAADTILSVKQRVFAANCKLPVRRQRLVYRPGPRGIEPLANDETLGGAGVARDGTAELDVLIEPLAEEELAALDQKVLCLAQPYDLCDLVWLRSSPRSPLASDVLYFPSDVLSHLFCVVSEMFSCRRARREVFWMKCAFC
jgi:hypothetical protein